jgi:hypothetical protein
VGGSSGSNEQQQLEQQPLLHSIWVNFQPHSDSNKVLGDSWQLLHGVETGWQEFGGVQLALQPGSFVQVSRIDTPPHHRRPPLAPPLPTLLPGSPWWDTLPAAC